ncbi:MAG: hypothetical protein WCQ89_03510, partial [Verrucomicrobiota bacterium]
QRVAGGYHLPDGLSWRRVNYRWKWYGVLTIVKFNGHCTRVGVIPADESSGRRSAVAYLGHDGF